VLEASEHDLEQDLREFDRALEKLHDRIIEAGLWPEINTRRLHEELDNLWERIEQHVHSS
jgi:DNA polymerase III delta prime subunit